MKVLSSFNFNNLTATAATEITALCPPRKHLVTRLTSIQYRCGTTAHTITMMKALGKTALSQAAAASQAVINLTSDPGSIAANDFVVIKLADNTYFLGKVSSVTAGLAVTLTASLPAAAAQGAEVWFMGAPGDHVSSQTRTLAVPSVGGQFLATISILNTWQDFLSGLCQGNGQNEPLVVHSNNATAAGIFEQVTGSHTLNT